MGERYPVTQSDSPSLVPLTQGADGSVTFSFDTGDGKPPAKKSGAAAGGAAPAAGTSNGGGASLKELEKDMAAAWKTAVAAAKGGR